LVVTLINVSVDEIHDNALFQMSKDSMTTNYHFLARIWNRMHFLILHINNSLFFVSMFDVLFIARDILRDIFFHVMHY